MADIRERPIRAQRGEAGPQREEPRRAGLFNRWGPAPGLRSAGSGNAPRMITLGVILLILGLIFNVGLLWTLGVILAVVGVIAVLLGSMERGIGGRRHYW